MHEYKASKQTVPAAPAKRHEGDPAGDSRTIEDRTSGLARHLKTSSEWLKRFMQGGK